MLIILIIESEKEYKEQLEEKIKALKSFQIDCKAQWTTTLNSALEIIKNNHIDLIITNLFLKDHVGIDIIEQLNESAPSLPIIISGKLITDPLADAAIIAGAQDFFTPSTLSNQLFARLIRYSLGRQKMIDHLRALSFTDVLTEVYNRRGFITLTKQQLEISLRVKQGFCLYLIDLDYFKRINDTYGHQVGDEVLIEITNVIKSTFRSYDVIGRVGGDEFAIIAINTSQSVGETLLETIFNTLEEQNKKRHKPYTLSISIGFAYFDPYKAISLEELFRIADESLYEAKQRTHK